MDVAGFITLILVIAVVGFLVWLITEKVPMADGFKPTLTVITIVFIVLWVLAVLTGHAALPHIPGLQVR